MYVSNFTDNRNEVGCGNDVGVEHARFPIQERREKRVAFRVDNAS